MAKKEVIKKAPGKTVTKKKAAPKATPVKKAPARKKKSNSEILIEAIVKGMQEKKAKNISVMDMRNLGTAVTDYFIVCHGTSTTHVNAIADSVEDQVYKSVKTWPAHVEGRQNNEWILLDYFEAVAHIFIEEKRDFYRIEKLWADAVLTKHE
jgi:ribosome-associated protein